MLVWRNIFRETCITRCNTLTNLHRIGCFLHRHPDQEIDYHYKYIIIITSFISFAPAVSSLMYIYRLKEIEPN